MPLSVPADSAAVNAEPLRRAGFGRTFDLDGETISIRQAPIKADEYVSFLGRSGLGTQYPKERFMERISAGRERPGQSRRS